MTSERRARSRRPPTHKRRHRSKSSERRRPGVVSARSVAVEALVRIDVDGAFANLALPSILERSQLDERDRRFATELVYGATRRRRSLDHLYGRFLHRDDLDPEVKAALRLGTYQLVVMEIPAHAAVGETTACVGGRGRGLVNAVLRKVAEADTWYPDEATELSYPDWIVDRLVSDLGRSDGVAALAAMNERPAVERRPDGYVQDLGSQWVVAACVEALDEPSASTVVDVCAAPGGKATGIAAAGARVIASDVRPERVGLIERNAAACGVSDRCHPVIADGVRLPVGDASADLVLLDAPCSGLGTLRRRPDARWRIEPDAVERLGGLQRRLLEAAGRAVKPGGSLVVSVCTLTRAETIGIDEAAAELLPAFTAFDASGSVSSSSPVGQVAELARPWGRGAILLPHLTGTDGMFLLGLRAPSV